MMRFIISRRNGFKREYWVGAALDSWSTEFSDAHQFDIFDEAYETMKEVSEAFTNMLVEQLHQHVETQLGPLPSMYNASPSSILVSVPSARGVVKNDILFDLELVVPSILVPEETKGE